MLIDLIRLPVIPLSLKSRMVILVTSKGLDSSFLNQVYFWPLETEQPPLSLGSQTVVEFGSLIKAVHVSLDSKWIFETIYEKKDGLVRCLYVRMISASKIISGISLKSIDYHRGQKGDIVPAHHLLNEMVKPNWWNSGRGEIVPPVFGEHALYEYLQEMSISYTQGVSQRDFNACYKPLLDYAPHLLNGLLKGEFDRAPHLDFHRASLFLNKHHHTWSLQEELRHRHKAMGCSVFTGQLEFDDLFIKIMSFPPQNLCVHMGIQDAILGRLDSLYISEIHDPYHDILLRSSQPYDNYQITRLQLFLREAVLIYCRLFRFDLEDFKRVSEKSSITLMKNTYEEIGIILHDDIHDNHVCFYTFVPELMMSTLSVGWFLTGYY